MQPKKLRKMGQALGGRWVARGSPFSGQCQCQVELPWSENGLKRREPRRLVPGGRKGGGLCDKEEELGEKDRLGGADSAPVTLPVTEQGQVRPPPSCPVRNVVGGPTLCGGAVPTRCRRLAPMLSRQVPKPCVGLG